MKIFFGNIEKAFDRKIISKKYPQSRLGCLPFETNEISFFFPESFIDKFLMCVLWEITPTISSKYEERSLRHLFEWAGIQIPKMDSEEEVSMISCYDCESEKISKHCPKCGTYSCRLHFDCCKK